MTNLNQGTEKPNSKLTEDQVREMRRLKKEVGLGKRKLSLMFNVSESVVGRILSGKAWTHVA